MTEEQKSARKKQRRLAIAAILAAFALGFYLSLEGPNLPPAMGAESGGGR